MPLVRPIQDATALSRVAARIIESKLEPGLGVRLLGLQTDQLIPESDERVYAVALFDDFD